MRETSGQCDLVDFVVASIPRVRLGNGEEGQPQPAAAPSKRRSSGEDEEYQEVEGWITYDRRHDS